MTPALRTLARLERDDPVLFGTVCGLISAVAYAGANIYLRRAAAADPAWVSCLKTLPTMLVALFLMGLRTWRGLAVWPSRRATAAILIAGTLAQVGGNLPFQWSLRVVGLALAVPLCTGTLIACAAILGRAWLGEPITPRALVSMALLIAAVGVLSYASRGVSQNVLANGDTGLLSLGVAAAAGSGVWFAANNVILRRTLSRRVPVSTALMLVSLTGLASLLPISVWNVGLDGLLATPAQMWFDILLAGSFNAAGFFLFGRSLEHLTMTRVNLFTAMQTAISSLAGVLLFAEPANRWLGVGLGLTVAGMLLMRRGRPAAAEQTSAPPIPIAPSALAPALADNGLSPEVERGRVSN